MAADLDSKLPQPEDLSAYLAIGGWNREESGHAASLWFNPELEGVDAGRLLLPHLPTAKDYRARVSMLLDAIALHQDKDVETVRREAALVHFDVAPLRAPDAGIDDSIPLQAGVDLITAARKMVVAAAGSTERRASHFGRSLTAKARDHSRIVRLGQTERGSYIVPIISRATHPGDHVVDPAHLDVAVEESLFERRVLTTLARSLELVQEIAVTRDRLPKGSEITDAVSVGVSRELCVGLLKALKSAAITDLDVGFRWSPATPPPRAAPTEVSFPGEAVESLTFLAETLRTLDLPRRDVLYGLVTELRHRPNDPQRRVGVEALVGRRLRTVYMSLTPEQYEVAQACHERSKVVVQGQLRAPAGDRAEMVVENFDAEAALDIDLPDRLDRGPQATALPTGIRELLIRPTRALPPAPERDDS